MESNKKKLEMSLGEKLELGFYSQKKTTKIIGNKCPVSFCCVSVAGVSYEVTKNVNISMPWFWKIVNNKTNEIFLLVDEWDLPSFS